MKKNDDNMKDTLTDDFESAKTAHSVNTKKNKLCRWQKILLVFLVVFSLVFVIGLLVFWNLRTRGEKALQAEEHRILYDGKEYRYRTESVNILCLGIDKDLSLEQMEAGRGNFGMTDVIMLVSIDTKKNKVKVISIPRDTMTEVQITTENGEVVQKEKLQICYQYSYGKSVEQCCELTVDAVSQLLYNTPIQRYCAVNFQAIPMLNDAVGGVDVVVQEHIEEWGTGFTYGENVHLEGERALLYIRARDHGDVDGATLRAQRQKQYAVAFVEKAKSAIKKDPSIPVTLFQELLNDGNMCTDITMEDITYLMPKALKMSFSEDMLQVIPGESVLGESGFAEYYMDVDAVKKLIIDTFYEEV